MQCFPFCYIRYFLINLSKIQNGFGKKSIGYYAPNLLATISQKIFSKGNKNESKIKFYLHEF